MCSSLKIDGLKKKERHGLYLLEITFSSEKHRRTRDIAAQDANNEC